MRFVNGTAPAWLVMLPLMGNVEHAPPPLSPLINKVGATPKLSIPCPRV